MNRAAQFAMKRFVSSMALVLLIGGSVFGPGTTALASGSGGGGNSSAPDAAGTVINLSNFKLKFNGVSANGKVTLGYAADGSAQSISFALGSINVPDGSVLPVNVVTGVYHTVFSYYSYTVLEYTTTPGTLTVKNKSVTLTLSTLNGDIIPPFSPVTVGTTDIHIYSPDGTTEVLGGSIGKLRP